MPEPIVETRCKNIISPRNNTDKLLVKILERLLTIKNISISDSFFELGGDSLTAINLCAKIYSELNVQIFVKDVLENPIIKDLSDVITSKSASYSDNITHIINNNNSYPVSSAQERTYYASNIAGNSSLLYNISGGLLLDKLPDIQKLHHQQQMQH